MRARLAAALVLCALAGCQAGTTHGFEVATPAGWKEVTDAAETKSNQEFELVFEGPETGAFPATITIARGGVEADVTLAPAVERARRLLRERIPGSDPTASVDDRLGGGPALRFDFGDEAKRARQITALHRRHLYAMTLQSHASAFERHAAVLEDLRRSWRWEEPATRAPRASARRPPGA